MGAEHNWFPGHMNKALKEIEERISVVDLVIEIVDARAPYSTQNPIFRRILKTKNVLYVLSKTDLADPKVTDKWISYFGNSENHNFVMTVDKKTQNIEQKLIKLINEATSEVQEKQRKKGIINPQLNVLILGLPNVGKSTFINKVVKNKSVKAGNKPGLTRGLQRISLSSNITLIDTPGIMPSVIENESIATNLVAINAVKEDVFPRERMAARAMRYVYNNYQGVVENTYKIKTGLQPPIDIDDTYSIFEKIARINRWILVEDLPDVERVMQKFLRDLQNGKLGRVSYESPELIGEITEETIQNKKKRDSKKDVTSQW